MLSPLRLQARLNEIDRQLYSHRFRMGALKWMGFPVMVLIVAYLSHFLYERGIGLTENVLAGLGGLVTSLVAGVGGYRALQRHVDELEDERGELKPPGSNAALTSRPGR